MLLVATTQSSDTELCNLLLLPSGDSDGFGVQRGENIQNGSEAAQVTLCVLRHHFGPNEKGKVPPGVWIWYCAELFHQVPACLFDNFEIVFYVLFISQGYGRVYMEIAEINIDVPRAYFILEQFVDKSLSMEIIDVKLRDLCPCR